MRGRPSKKDYDSNFLMQKIIDTVTEIYYSTNEIKVTAIELYLPLNSGQISDGYLTGTGVSCLHRIQLCGNSGVQSDYGSAEFDSGCRDQEILDLWVKDFVTNQRGEAELRIIGKGRKYCVTPISKGMVGLFYDYCCIYCSNFVKVRLFYDIPQYFMQNEYRFTQKELCTNYLVRQPLYFLSEYGIIPFSTIEMINKAGNPCKM